MAHRNPIIHPVIKKIPMAEQLPRGRERVRTLSRLAREAARDSAQKSRLDIFEFPKNNDGAPIPTHGIYWSITHKSDYVGGVVAEKPVGIDIEKKRPIHPGLMEKIAGKEEWALVTDQTTIHFLRFWTAKEAVLKAMGVGFTGLSKCHIIDIVDDHHLVVEFDGSPLNVHQTWFTENHIVAITQAGPQTALSIRWHYI